MSEETKIEESKKEEEETIPDSVEAYLGKTPWWRPRTRKLKAQIIESKPNKLKFLLDGETHTLLQPLQVELLKDPRVKFAAYSVTHPLEEKAEFVVETDGSIDPLTVIKEALERIRTTLHELRDKLIKSLKEGTSD